MAYVIAFPYMPFLSTALQYNKPKSLKTAQAFLGFAENEIYLLGFQIQNNIWIIEGSDYGGSDNRGPTLLKYLMIIEIPYSGKLDWWGESLASL